MNQEQRQHFLEGRKGIGSSDVPKILGWSRFGGLGEAYDSITSILDGTFVAGESSFAAERGGILEPVAADKWCADHDRDTSSIRRQPQRAHPKYPHLIANVDRQILSSNGSGPSILEIKCPMLPTFLRVRDFGETKEYVAQLQHQLAIYDYPVGYLGIYHPDHQMLDIEVLRDDDFINDVLHPACNNFWEDHILPRRRPEPEEIEEEARIPELKGGKMEVDESPAFNNRVEKYLQTKEMKATVDALHAHNGQVIKEYMEENEMVGVAGAGVRIHYKEQAGSLRWDLKKVAKYMNAQGMDISEFKVKNKPSRPLRVYLDKNQEKE